MKVSVNTHYIQCISLPAMDPVSCHFCRTSSYAVCWVQVNLDISDRTYKHIAQVDFLVTYFSTWNICCSYRSKQLFNRNSRILTVYWPQEQMCSDWWQQTMHL